MSSMTTTRRSSPKYIPHLLTGPTLDNPQRRFFIMVLNIDFETSSLCDLKTSGAYVYAQHPSTDILCISFRDRISEELWAPGKPLPLWVQDALASDRPLAAFNAAFERLIWQHVGVPKYGFPPLELERWHCTMAQVSTLGMPKSLEKAAAFLGLANQKDKQGAKAMATLSRPDKKTGKLLQGSPEMLQALYSYCSQDTLVEQQLALSVPPMSDAEREVWLLDQRINDFGVPVDRGLALAAQALWADYSKTLDEEVVKLAGCSGTQVAALKKWLEGQLGKPVPSLDKPAIAQLLARQDLSPEVRRVIKLRQELGSAGLKKFAKFVSASTDGDQRIRGTLRYHGASTGRWSGYLIQPQNLPRPTISQAEVPTAVRLVKAKDAESIDMLFGSVSDTISSLCRAAITSDEGLAFIDYAAIEARMVAWLAGQEDLLKAFRDKSDPYVAMASQIYNKPVESITKDQRFFGKTCVLGCGYQMGHVKFRDSVQQMTGRTISETFAERCVKTYREVNNHIVDLWYRLDRGVKRCLNLQQSIKLTDNLSCRADLNPNGDTEWLYIRLPSGRDLAYYHPKLTPGKFGEQIAYTSVDGQTGNPMRSRLYGGAILENVSQALSRDVMADAMLKLDMLGYKIAFTVHDEIILEGVTDLEPVEALMRVPPPWAEGLPLEVEGQLNSFYWK